MEDQGSEWKQIYFRETEPSYWFLAWNWWLSFIIHGLIFHIPLFPFFSSFIIIYPRIATVSDLSNLPGWLCITHITHRTHRTHRTHWSQLVHRVRRNSYKTILLPFFLYFLSPHSLQMHEEARTGNLWVPLTVLRFQFTWFTEKKQLHRQQCERHTNAWWPRLSVVKVCHINMIDNKCRAHGLR